MAADGTAAYLTADATRFFTSCAEPVATDREAWRALRLRCPACGLVPIFHGWFAMHKTCANCGRRFDRAPGYLLGSVYFNCLKLEPYAWPDTLRSWPSQYEKKPMLR
jgi:hypothetical protein